MLPFCFLFFYLEPHQSRHSAPPGAFCLGSASWLLYLRALSQSTTTWCFEFLIWWWPSIHVSIHPSTSIACFLFFYFNWLCLINSPIQNKKNMVIIAHSTDQGHTYMACSWPSATATSYSTAEIRNEERIQCMRKISLWMKGQELKWDASCSPPSLCPFPRSYNIKVQAMVRAWWGKPSWNWRDGLTLKSTCCSCRGSSFNSQTHMLAHNYPFWSAQCHPLGPPWA